MTSKPGVVLFLVSVGCVLPSCAQGPQFAVNERIFELPSMKSAGAGCLGVRLGSGSEGGTETGGGSDGSPLVIATRIREDMTVQVTESGRLLVERVYDEAFFLSGRLDEFSVTASTGQGRFLRYWASFDADGRPECAPLEEAGPR
jgi:hypothetical protein